MSRSVRSRAGFTLLELAIVLVILGVLTAVATREIDKVQAQQRFEASQRGLETIREAVWGSPDDRAADGSRIQSGFVADLGRLPDFAGEGLAELWANRTGGAYEVQPAAADADVLVAGGWRGPYARLPVGAEELRDGWGNAYTSKLETGVWRVGHLGADGKEGGTDYDQDVFLDFPDRAAEAWTWGQVEVSTNLLTPGLAYFVRVRLYGPDGSEESAALPIGFPTNTVNWTELGPVPVGLRAVRAYLEGPATNRSAIRYVGLRSGANGPVNLVINW